MAFMLIAVTMFFALAGMLIIMVKFSDIKNSAIDLEQKNAMALSSKLASSPEFSCGNSFGTTKINCIDLDKVFILSQNIEKYSNFWDMGEIKIIKIFPEIEESECDLGNYPDCESLTVFSKDVEKGIGSSVYVSLCYKDSVNDKTTNRCDIGLLIVSPEDRSND